MEKYGNPQIEDNSGNIIIGNITGNGFHIGNTGPLPEQRGNDTDQQEDGEGESKEEGLTPKDMEHLANARQKNIGTLLLAVFAILILILIAMNPDKAVDLLSGLLNIPD